mgnify:CR=1 FL=1
MFFGWFINLFKEVQRLKTQLDQYTDLTDENNQTIEQIIPKDTLRAFKGMYLETAQRLREKQGKNSDTSNPIDQLDFEFVLFASAVVDYDFIESHIKRICSFFNVKMIAYDRYNSNHLIQKLTEAECSEMIKFSQNMTWFNAPIREIELLAHQGRLNHQNNKVLNWHCSNVVLMKDSNDNMKFDKAKSIEKIDGMVALAMAMGVCLVDLKEKVEENIYEQRGLIDL